MKMAIDAAVYELVKLIDCSVTQEFAFRALPRDGRLALILRELVRVEFVNEWRDDYRRTCFMPAGEFALCFGVQDHGLDAMTYEWRDLAKSDVQLVSALRRVVRSHCISRIEHDIGMVSTIFALYSLAMINLAERTPEGISWIPSADYLEKVEDLRRKSNGKTPRVTEYLDEAGIKRFKVEQQ